VFIVNTKLNLPSTTADIRTTYFYRLSAYFCACISYGSQIEGDHLTNIVYLLLFKNEIKVFTMKYKMKLLNI